MIRKLGSICLFALVLTTCDLKSEFDVNPTDFFMQKKTLASRVLGFDPPNVADWHDFSMRGFLLGTEPCFAIKTNFTIEAVPGIYLIDKDLHLIKKLTQTELTNGGAVTWDPSMSNWTIATNKTGSKLVISVNVSPYNNGVPNYMIFELNRSNYSMNSWDAAGDFRSVRRVGNYLFDQLGGTQVYDPFFSAYTPPASPLTQLSGSGYFYMDVNGKVVNFTNAPISQNQFFVFERNNTPFALRVQPSNNTGGYFGLLVIMPVVMSDYSQAQIYAAVDSSPLITLDFAYSQQYDGQLVDAERYLDNLAMVSAGLIVPYPSGRDRLFDPLNGKLLHIFDLNVQNEKDSGNSKDRYNHPRAYINGQDMWFMYDQDTRELKRLAGWWL